MQTPSLLQQITAPKSQIQKSGDKNESNQLDSNKKTSSSFNAMFNSEVNHQQKTKPAAAKNEQTNINKEQNLQNEKNKKPIERKTENNTSSKALQNSNKDTDEDVNEGAVVTSNQNILTFVENIGLLSEQMKIQIKEQAKNQIDTDSQSENGLLINDNQQSRFPLFSASPLVGDTSNTISQNKETTNTDTSLIHQGMQSIKVKSETLSESIEQANSIASELLDQKEIIESGKNTILVGASNAFNRHHTNSELSAVSISDMSSNEVSFDHSSKIKEQINLGSTTKELQNIKPELNASIDIDINKKLQASSIDLSEKTKTDVMIPKIESHLAQQLGITTEQLKANGIPNFIPANLGSKAWEQAMGQRIIWMVAGGEQSAQLSLNPPDLGPLQVVLKISDNQVDASFISSHLDVRETIESAMPKLRHMMDEAGIALSGFSVSSQASQSGSAFSQENTQQRMHKSDVMPDTAIQMTAKSAPNIIKKEIGLVDTFV